MLWESVEPKGDVPPEMCGSTAVVHKDSVYFFGGNGEGFVYFDHLYRFTPGKWSFTGQGWVQILRVSFCMVCSLLSLQPHRIPIQEPRPLRSYPRLGRRRRVGTGTPPYCLVCDLASPLYTSPYPFRPISPNLRSGLLGWRPVCHQPPARGHTKATRLTGHQ